MVTPEPKYRLSRIMIYFQERIVSDTYFMTVKKKGNTNNCSNNLCNKSKCFLTVSPVGQKCYTSFFLKKTELLISDNPVKFKAQICCLKCTILHDIATDTLRCKQFSFIYFLLIYSFISFHFLLESHQLRWLCRQKHSQKERNHVKWKENLIVEEKSFSKSTFGVFIALFT